MTSDELPVVEVIEGIAIGRGEHAFTVFCRKMPKTVWHPTPSGDMRGHIQETSCLRLAACQNLFLSAIFCYSKRKVGTVMHL